MPTSYIFSLFASIMYGTLNPNQPENANGGQFTYRLQALALPTAPFAGKYRIGYLRPISPKTAYYKQFLLQETDRYCSSMCDEIASQSDERILAYLRDQILDKHLSTSLLRVGDLIAVKGYRLEDLDKPPVEVDREQLSAVYIFHLLKVCLAKAYLEVQHVLAGEVKRPLCEEDLYLRMAGELPPVRTFLTESIPAWFNETKGTPDLTGFTYKFLADYADNLRNLHDGLMKAELIASDTTFPRFKMIFAGKPVERPVVWTGNISELFYFIKLLHNEYEAVADTRQRQWEIACRCFVRPDGSCFQREKLKGQKKPVRTADVIERLVGFLEY